MNFVININSVFSYGIIVEPTHQIEIERGKSYRGTFDILFLHHKKREITIKEMNRINIVLSHVLYFFYCLRFWWFLFVYLVGDLSESLTIKMTR